MPEEVVLGFSDPQGPHLEQVVAAHHLQRIGPTIDAVVEFYTGKSGISPPTDPKTVEALIDTGAAMSSIDEELARELQLPLVGRHKVGGVGGMTEAPEYLAKLSVPRLNRIKVGKVVGLKLSEVGQHKMLLGREFLRQFRMTYDGRSGIVVVENKSKSLPSFIEGNKILIPAKVGRKSKLPPRRRRMRR